MKLSIRKFDKAELKALQDEAKVLYQNRTDGSEEDFTQPMNSAGLFPRRMVKGALEQITERSASAYITTLLAKIAEGYQRAKTIEQESIGIVLGFVIKPEAVQQEELKEVYAAVEADYRAEIERHNKAVEEQMVEKLLAEREEEERKAQAAKQRGAREAAQAEVRAALGFK